MLRVAFVSSIFPNSAEPLRGSYNYKLVEALQKITDLEVFCPLASFPSWKWLRARAARYRNVDVNYRPPDVKVTYIPYHSLPLLGRPFNGLNSGRVLLPYIREHKPDLVLASWVYPEGYGALRVCESLGIPIVVTALGSDLRRVPDPVSRKLVRTTMQRCDSVITVSREMKRWAVRYGAPAGKIHPILNGCDAKIFYPRDRGAARSKLGLDLDIELIVFVGWFSPAKGLRELLHASTTLLAARPRLHLALIGDGIMRKEIEVFVANSGRPERYHLPGALASSQIAEWLGAANLLSLPSYSEGCPNVVVEALSCGRPVVASEVGGIPELLTPSTGIMTPPCNVDKLAQALREALDRTWDPDHIRQTARRSWEQMAGETVAVCEETYERVRNRKAPTMLKQIPEESAPTRAKSRPRRLKIAVVTSFFPSALNPYYGIPVFRTVLALNELAELKVLCPVPLPARMLVRPEERAARLLKPEACPRELSIAYLAYQTLPVISRPLNGFQAASSIRARLASFYPDLVLSYWIYPDGFGSVLEARRLGLPVILGSRGSDLRFLDPLSKPLTKYALLHCDGLLTVSEELRQRALDAGVPPDRAHTIRNGIDAQRFQLRDKTAARADLSIPLERNLLLYVGRVDPAKGVRELLAAFDGMKDRHPDLDLAIIGGGMEQELRRFTEKHGDRVRTLGACDRDTIATWLAAADLFCLPSYAEGCPNVILEALASGIPVVASAVGGIPEILTPECGVLIAPHSAAEVVRGIENALERQWNRQAIARHWNRSWETVATETYEICQETFQRFHGNRLTPILLPR